MHYVKICKRFAVLGLGLPVCKMQTIETGTPRKLCFSVFQHLTVRESSEPKKHEQYEDILNSRGLTFKTFLFQKDSEEDLQILAKNALNFPVFEPMHSKFAKSVQMTSGKVIGKNLRLQKLIMSYTPFSRFLNKTF